MLARPPVADRAQLRAQVAAIAAAIACVAIVGIGLSLTLPLFSLEMERMGVSTAVIGLNTAMAGLASILTVPFVPRLAARIGVVRLLMGAVGLAAGMLLAFRWLDTIAWWFPLRFVFSACLGALFVLSEFWINMAAPPARRGLVMGIYASVLALGFAVGPTLLALVGTRGWTPYLAGCGLFGLGLVPLALARRLSPVIAPSGQRRVLGYLALAPVAVLASALYGAVETGGFAILPLYGLRLGLDAATAAWLVSAVALGNVLFQIPVGLIADRTDRRAVLLAASLLGALGAALMPSASASLPLLCALLFVWGGIAGTLYTVGLAHLGSSLGGSDLAGANAAFVMLYNVGLMAGPPVIGGAMDIWSPQGFAWAMAALFLAYALIVGGALRRSAAAR